MLEPRSIHEAFDSQGEVYFEPSPASAVCPHKKGSWEQIDWLRKRAEAGEELFHESDNLERIHDSERERVNINRKILEFRKSEKLKEIEEQKKLVAERRKKRREISGTGLATKRMAK
jgi:hypothetical protein